MVLEFEQWLLALVFILAGIGKIMRFRVFLDSGMRFLGSSSGQLRRLLWLMPGTELGAGVLLLWGVTVVGVTATVLGALTVFTSLMVRNLTIGRAMPCACFGSESATAGGTYALSRNLVLIVVAVTAFALELAGPGGLRLPGWVAQRRDGEAVPGLIAASMVISAYWVYTEMLQAKAKLRPRGGE